MTVSRRQLLQGLTALTAVGMAGGVTGCGSGSGGTSKVSAWIYRPEYRQAVTSILDAFHDDHPDIDIDMDYKPTGQYPTLLKTALVGGAAPDLIATNGASGIWGDLGADNGYILPLDGKLDQDVLVPSVRDVVQYKGHTYAAPVQMFRIGVYYQKAAFAKHGLEPPKTWDDLTTIAKTLKRGGVTPWSMPAQDMIIPYFFYHLAANSILGTQGYAELRAGKRKLTDPDLLPAAELVADLPPYCNAGFKSVAYAEGKALFAQGKTAMTIGGSSDLAGYLEINPKLDVGFFGFPTRDGRPGTALSGLSMAYVVNKKANQQKGAITFATWLTSARAQQLVMKHLGLPSRNGIKPSGEDIRSKVLRRVLDVPVSPSWVDFPETGNTATAATNGGAGIFTGRLSAKRFASLIQGAIKPKASG